MSNEAAEIEIPVSLQETIKEFRGYNLPAALEAAERLQKEAAHYESIDHINRAFDRMWDDLQRDYRQRQYALHIRRGEVIREWERQNGERAE